MMRIITGTARGTKLLAPEGITTRPTSERAKEGLFNVLQFEIERKRVLDLFAGSGQMALEALSRGAEYAVLVDSDEEAAKIIRKNIEKTHTEAKCSLLCAEYTAAVRELAKKKERFDLVFLDPPYSAGLLPDTLARLTREGLLSPGATVVCEDENDFPQECGGLTCVRELRYGRIHFTILKKETEQ